MKRPLIGIPIGDPAGIGPEIALKALKNGELYKICKPLIIGNFEALRKIECMVKTGLMLSVVTEPKEGKYTYGTADIISLDEVPLGGLVYGKIQAQAGRAAYEFLKKAIELADRKKIDAIAAAPASKEAIEAAGINYRHQSEINTVIINPDKPIAISPSRISVVRGTAFDIAGKGIASSLCMEQAVKLAAEYSRPAVDGL